MSGDLRARDARRVWHPFTQHGLEPDALPVVGARGALLELEDGRELIDAISSWWTCLHGHGHPRLAEALQAQVERLDHVIFAGCTHPPAVDLAEALVAATPEGLERVFYSDNGSTSVEVALKIAYQAWVQRDQPERRVFVALEGAYHGDTFGAMSVGEREPFFRTFEPLLFEVRHARPEADAIDATLSELGSRAAGVILEPLVQGAAGMVMHDAALVRAVRAACDAHGVPMIADEVMTGFGRTGALFACAKAGVTPDLMCLSKGLTGGTMPLAATLASEGLFEAFLSEDRRRTFFHGHSFTANPIGCAVACASLALCLEQGVPARLEAIGARIGAALERSGIRGVRRTGGIVALDLEVPADDTGYTSTLSLRLRERAVERGVLLRPLGNVLYAMPPACTSEAECDRIAAVMSELAAG
jgi:adenosylmethionine-8-amino-7-oxononanoate aminotransferase